jgi:hypothetical protein
MLASRSRKLCQSPSTSPAVHTVRARTEPKRPAPFTYLQIHAQVVHFVPFQSVLLPRRASIFSMAEWARLSCCGMPFASPLRSAGSVGRCDSFPLSLFQCGVVPWEKSITLLPPTRLRIQSSSLAPPEGDFDRSTASVPYWESLKVIAFDKITVNSNLSSG